MDNLTGQDLQEVTLDIPTTVWRTLTHEIQEYILLLCGRTYQTVSKKEDGEDVFYYRVKLSQYRVYEIEQMLINSQLTP